MKHLLTLLACVFAFSFLACDSEVTPATTDGSTLNITPGETVTLAATDSVKTADMKLSCGCKFTLELLSITGDTSVIKYSPVNPMTQSASMHSMRFMYSPSQAASGEHSIKLDFRATKGTYTYTNSVVAQVK